MAAGAAFAPGSHRSCKFNKKKSLTRTAPLASGRLSQAGRFGPNEEYKSKKSSPLMNSYLFMITALHQSEY
jgi:hypothetical protein